MNQLLLAIALGAGALSNFPVETGGKVAHPAVAVVLGGAPAVVVPAGDLVTGFRADGATPAGLPFQLGPDQVASGAVAAADMDGDGRLELAVATTSGKVFLWSGGVVAPFPVDLGARVKAGVSFADVDADGRPELVVGDDRGRVHALERSGAAAKGFPRSTGRAVTSAVSSSVFAGARTLAFGAEDGRVHVVDAATGKARAGFPLATHFTVSGAPVFADLDGDGEMDLVVASQDFGVYAVNAAGAPLPGFPVRAAYRIYEGPAVADLDGDGGLDVVFASADGFVHAVSARGSPLPGFPARVGARLFGGPAVGDLDRDGTLDVAVVLADGTVAALTRLGRPLPGFPEALGAEAAASPLLHDLGQEGGLSIFVGAASGGLHAVRAQKVGAAPGIAAWPVVGRDAARSGRSGPNPPGYKELRLEPGAPRVTDALQARWRGYWLDAAPGEAPPAPTLTWVRDGKAVPELAGKRELPPGTARRGQRWGYVLEAPHGGGRFPGPEVVVLDTAPAAPEVALEPAAPSRAGPVRAVVTRPSADVDGDVVRYAYAWLQDGLETGVTSDTFPGDRLRKGALLAARVTPTDGELAGRAATAQARVGDTAPGPLAVVIEPALPRATDPIRARVAEPASDVDGDALRYHHRWTVAGEPRNVPLATAELPPGLFRKHQEVRVEARAFDGQLEGPPATTSVKVLNTPPTAAAVAILPARPRKGEALRAVFTAPAADVDRDPLAYRFTWRKNGAALAVSGDGREVPGAEVARGDRFEVTVVASDGEADGPPASAIAVVGNTPPVPPRIALEPQHPRGGAPIALVVTEPARDADGDAVRLGIVWTRDGKPTGAGAETLAPSDFRKHERVRVVVTPRDGEDAGAPVAYEVVVDDAPPGAPVIAFTSAAPTVTAPLAVAVKTAAADPDGDPIRYRYRWLRDGVPVPQPDGTEASRQPPFWTAAAEVPRSQLAKGQRWEVEAQAFDGEEHGPVARAATTIVNTPPPPPRLAFAPERPRRVDGLALALTQPADADGDVLTYRYAWTRNGDRFDAPPDQAQIPRDVPRKGERWGVEVIANDGEADAPATRLQVTIADTAPTGTSVALCDGPVPSGTTLQARVTLAATDADLDPVTYRHDWTVNGNPIAAMAGQARLTAPSLRKHDLVRVVVTPWDGELAGPAAAAECQVVNTPPTAPTVALEPSAPTARSGLQVVVRKTSTDRDGDAVTYRYAWTRDGLPAPFEGASVAAGVLRHREVWQVEVTPFDGEAEGERVRASAVVRNTAPSSPSVVVKPEAPGVGEALTCDVLAPQRDVDQEPLAIAYRWYRNDRLEPLAEGAPGLPSGVVRRGERWRCEAWTSDGTDTGPHATAEVTVRNGAPGAPVITVEPERPRKADDLVCRVTTAAVDPDADAVTYTYAWWRDERPVPTPPGADPTRVAASRVARGQRWRCAATPSDGTMAGPSGTADRVILNTPPGPARVAIQPAAPRDGQVLRCEITGPSEDADGDQLRYRLTWFRNGTAQPFAETSQEVPARLVKGGDRWRCQAVPHDGTDDGPAAGSEELEILPGTRDGAPGISSVGLP